MRMKYKLFLTCILDDLDREVNIDFYVPTLYNTYEKAESANSLYYVKPEKLSSGEVVFQIYKKGETVYGINPYRNDIIVDTVHWKQYWKYQCTILKEKEAIKTLNDAMPGNDFGEFGNFPCTDMYDYEPYADKFEIIYNKYLTRKTFEDVNQYSVQCIAYGIVPVILF